MTVTKQTIKDIHALILKKHRDAMHAFVAEGPKVVVDLLPLMRCKVLYATQDFLNGLPSELTRNVELIEVVDKKVLERLSLLCAPRDTLAVFESHVRKIYMMQWAEICWLYLVSRFVWL